MFLSRNASGYAAIALALCLLAAPAVAQPDVIVGTITGPSNYTADATHDAFSLGTTSCNIGTSNLTWIASNNQHPVIGGGLYKIENGRFLHIGRSWLKHGFTALQGSVCTPCQGTGNGSALGVGCSDPYGSGLNGNQGPLGPRSQVNASTGFFPYPPANPPYSGTTARRLKVLLSDLTTGPNTQYVTEAQYIQPEDATANVDDNNASYRLATISGGATNRSMSFSGSTIRMEPAIMAWAAQDPGVIIQNLQVPGVDGGRIIVASKKTDIGGGMFHYEYAVHNLNCHDSVGSFGITFPNGTTFANAGMHSTAYNDGNATIEAYNNNPWTTNTASNGITFNVDQTFAQNPLSNAIRWASTHSFWFDASGDTTGSVVGLYRSGGSQSLPAPTFPVPSWQVNQAASSLDVDGLVNDGFVGPIQANLQSGTPHVLNFGTNAPGSPFEIFLCGVPGIADFFTTPNGQKVNIDFTHPSFTGLYGGGAIIPGNASIPFVAPNAVIFTALQMLVVDGVSADGYTLSAMNEINIAPCMPATQPLTMGDDNSIQILLGAGQTHDCLNDVTFYGVNYTDFYVNSNGSVSFTTGSGDFTSSGSEFTSQMPRLAGCWSDLSPNVGGTVNVISGTNGIITVSFAGVPEYNGSGSATFDMQFDSVNDSCAILNYNCSFNNDTVVGISPGSNAASQTVSWSALNGAGMQTGAAMRAIYEDNPTNPPSGFSSISFPNADASSYIVQ